jgi:hypothetical protein
MNIDTGRWRYLVAVEFVVAGGSAEDEVFNRSAAAFNWV